MKLVYIASPFAGDMENNTQKAREYCLSAIEEGVVPVAPHLLYPQFLDDGDPRQRSLGLQAGLDLLARCDELWVCGDEISPGMSREIQFAKGLGIPVRHMDFAQEQKVVLALCRSAAYLTVLVDSYWRQNAPASKPYGQAKLKRFLSLLQKSISLGCGMWGILQS